jgi:transposase
MKYYTSTTEYNCGIDLHARQMYVCVMDRQGKKLVHTNVLNNDFDYFLKLVAPYRHDLTVCCECMFGWYWLADACQAAGLTFVLAHALYVKAIHGGKNKNDRIDSEKLTHLLRSNLIPPAYVYPAEQRPLRALLRQRLFFVWRRVELTARVYSHQLAHNREPIKHNRRVRDPWVEALLKAEDHPLRQIALKNDLAMICHFDHQISQLEEELQRQTKKVASRDYALLQTVPGIGEVLGLTILYEIGDINRFPSVKDFLSYCRLVKGTVASAGKIKGLRGAKLGNPYLRWAFGEAAVIAKRDHYLVGPLSQRLEAQMNGNKFKSNTVVAIKLARAVYFMLKNKTVFDPERLVASMRKCLRPASKLPRRTDRPALTKGQVIAMEKHFSPGRGQPGSLTGGAKKVRPTLAADHPSCASSTSVCVGPASTPADSIGTRGQRLTSNPQQE